MRKIFDRKTIFTILITTIIYSGGIAIASTVYQANTINYSPKNSDWKVSDVEAALNSLYSMSDELKVCLNETGEDNWRAWAAKANIDHKNYADISALLADSNAVNTLFNSEEAVEYMMESRDNYTYIRRNILDNTNIAILALKNDNIKSKILSNLEWRQMILDRTALIEAIISNNLHTSLSTRNSTKTYDVNYGTVSLNSNFTLKENDLVLKGTAYLSFDKGGGMNRRISLYINGANVASNSGSEYLLPYNGSNIQATAYNRSASVSSAHVAASAAPSFNASSVDYCETIVSGTLYVLR